MVLEPVLSNFYTLSSTRLICSHFKARTSKNDKKSTYSHHDMIYINGKLKACAFRICNCF